MQHVILKHLQHKTNAKTIKEQNEQSIKKEYAT
jgi:hypothetical protein